MLSDRIRQEMLRSKLIDSYDGKVYVCKTYIIAMSFLNTVIKVFGKVQLRCWDIFSSFALLPIPLHGLNLAFVEKTTYSFCVS